jgi:hypothetical protein
MGFGVINEKAALLSAIDRLVDQLKADGSVIDTNAVALQLLSFYPERAAWHPNRSLAKSSGPLS